MAFARLRAPGTLAPGSRPRPRLRPRSAGAVGRTGIRN